MKIEEIMNLGASEETDRMIEKTIMGDDFSGSNFHPTTDFLSAKLVLETMKLVTTIGWLPKTEKYMILVNSPEQKPIINITASKENLCLCICQSALLWKEYSKK
jgi:hypothetical protein